MPDKPDTEGWKVPTGPMEAHAAIGVYAALVEAKEKRKATHTAAMKAEAALSLSLPFINSTLWGGPRWRPMHKTCRDSWLSGIDLDAEYELIRQKKSGLSASQRRAVCRIVEGGDR